MVSSFEVPAPIRTFTFEEGHRFHGVEVKSLPFSMGDYKEILRLIDSYPGSDKAEIHLQKVFENILVEWNLTSGGHPVPCTPDGMGHLDSAWINGLLTELYSRMVQPDADQKKESNGGENLLHDALPPMALGMTPTNQLNSEPPS